MSDAPAQLIMQRGPSVNQVYDLTQERLQIGRSADNDIPVNDAEVSRKHAHLVLQPDGQYSIEDSGSTNGTFVNGKRIQGIVLLQDGDLIDFGDSIRFQYLEPVFAPVSPPEAEDDTADLEPLPVTPPQTTPAPRYDASEEDEAYYDEDSQPIWAQRNVLIGCGCGLLLFVCLCSSSLLILDWYRQGELLYCGGLRPLFEFLLNLGPLEFDPVACPTASLQPIIF
ncbi:MAG: FHA domain-containing protein [Chloroflexota bacterium]